MKRKSRGMILALIIIIILVAGLAAFLRIMEKEPVKQDTTSGEILTTKETQILEKESEIPEVSEEYKVDIGDVEYSVISVKKTQDAGLLEYRKDNNINENGVPKDGYAYIVVELGIVNNTQDKVDGTYNNIELNLYDEDSSVENVPLYMTDTNYDKIEKSNYFDYTVDSGKQQIRRLVYVVSEDNRSKSIVLCVDPYGQSGAVIRGKTKDGDVVYLDASENVQHIVLDGYIKE